MKLRLREVIPDVSKDRVAFIVRDYFLMDLEPSDATSQPGRPESLVTPQWKPKNSRPKFYYGVASDVTSTCSVVGYSSRTAVLKLGRTNKTNNQLRHRLTQIYVVELEGDLTGSLLAVDSTAR